MGFVNQSAISELISMASVTNSKETVSRQQHNSIE